MKKFRGWEFCDWESLKDHKEVIDQLKTIIESKYGLRLVSFVRKEAEIARKHRLPNPWYYVAHKPDIIFTDGNKSEDRIVLEYINTKDHFLFDLRGMIALSNVYTARKFICALRHNISDQYGLTNLHEKTNGEAMSLRSLLCGLDVSLKEGNLNYLCHKMRRKKTMPKLSETAIYLAIPKNKRLSGEQRAALIQNNIRVIRVGGVHEHLVHTFGS